jgi:uncharacterized lipoprotein YajG
MKMILIGLACLVFSGCATNHHQMYYDTTKSLSKDNTVVQTACWAAISDIAKNGDNAAKVGAIALAEKCKNDTLKIEAPKRNWMGFY